MVVETHCKNGQGQEKNVNCVWIPLKGKGRCISLVWQLHRGRCYYFLGQLPGIPFREISQTLGSLIVEDEAKVVSPGASVALPRNQC